MAESNFSHPAKISGRSFWSKSLMLRSAVHPHQANRKIIFEEFQPLYYNPPALVVTDRRTDRQTTFSWQQSAASHDIKI